MIVNSGFFDSPEAGVPQRDSILSRFISLATIFAVISSLSISLAGFALKSEFDGFVNLLYAVLAYLINRYLKKSRNVALCSWLLLGLFTFVSIVLVMRLEENSFAHLIFVVFPLLAVVLMGQKRGILLTILYSPIVLFLSYQRTPNLDIWEGVLFVICILIVIIISSLYESTVQRFVVALESAYRELEVQRDMVTQLAIRDELTGLFNRRWFNEVFPKELSRSIRSGEFLCFFIIDVDSFKQYNDNYGHQAGDKALQKVSEHLQEELRRAGDTLFRLGGEEFGGLIHGPDAEKIITKMEHLCAVMEKRAIPHIYQPERKYLTLSVGLVVCTMEKDYSYKEDEIYRLADEALYRSKAEGRNRVSSVVI